MQKIGADRGLYGQTSSCNPEEKGSVWNNNNTDDEHERGNRKNVMVGLVGGGRKFLRNPLVRE
eukprot:scaffold34618_cov159-Amphora_coffeaeformis.AAC.6